MNILLTSVGRRTYMVEYFKDALKGTSGKVFATNSALTYSLTVADDYALSPLIYDDAYIEFLISYCKQNEIKLIVSLFDIDLPILAKNKVLFKDLGIEIIVSDIDKIEICNDKWLSFNFLKDNDVNTPLTFINIDYAKKAILDGILNFPIILKPRWGMGSIGIYEAENINELDVFYNKTKNNILSSYLKYESNMDIDHAIIIQEKIIGIEYGLDIFNNLNREFLTCVPKQKLAMRAGETDGAIVLENPILFNLGKKISSILKHIANLDVDVFKVNDSYYILEMNCRFGGQYPFSHMAGVNFPKAIINMSNNEPVNPKLLHFINGTEGFKDICPKVLK